MAAYIENFWIEYKNSLKTIAELLCYLCVYIGLNNLNSPLLGLLFLILAIGNSVFALYQKIRYRKGLQNYILIPTQNDLYSKMTSLVLGSGIFICAVVLLYFKTISFYAMFPVTLLGVLIFFNGWYDLPKAKLNISNTLITVNGTKSKEAQLQLIEIFNNRILLTDITGKLQRVDNLNINVLQGELIKQYILTKTYNAELLVVNSIN